MKPEDQHGRQPQQQKNTLKFKCATWVGLFLFSLNTQVYFPLSGICTIQMQPFHDCMCSAAVFVCPLDCADVVHARLLCELHQAVVEPYWGAPAAVGPICPTPLCASINFIHVWLLPTSLLRTSRELGPVYPANRNLRLGLLSRSLLQF